MKCPVCSETDTRVVDSRVVADSNQIRRRRACEACGARFTTFETAEVKLPRLIKSDGTREPFEESKLRKGMERSLYKRSVTADEIDAAIARIKQKLLAAEREVDARVVGNLVMAELADMDHVAYVRFASVYRNFEDIGDFSKTVEDLQHLSHGAELSEKQISLIESKVANAS